MNEPNYISASEVLSLIESIQNFRTEKQKPERHQLPDWILVNWWNAHGQQVLDALRELRDRKATTGNEEEQATIARLKHQNETMKARLIALDLPFDDNFGPATW